MSKTQKSFFLAIKLTAFLRKLTLGNKCLHKDSCIQNTFNTKYNRTFAKKYFSASRTPLAGFPTRGSGYKDSFQLRLNHSTRVLA